ILPLTSDDSVPTDSPKPSDDFPAPLTGRVLIIDDEDSIRKTTARLVESLGLVALTASGGLEGVRIVQEGEVDIALLDMTMPGLDGYETYTLLRSVRTDLPIVLSTGYDGDKASQRFKDGELAAVLRKPYDRDTLYRTLVTAKPALAHSMDSADRPVAD
ncbi:MAG TPA: response regulator, partial [Spirochaetales bacterium]|nr:response regulator [Spirochaetales bacterium]